MTNGKEEGKNSDSRKQRCQFPNGEKGKKREEFIVRYLYLNFILCGTHRVLEELLDYRNSGVAAYKDDLMDLAFRDLSIFKNALNWRHAL